MHPNNVNPISTPPAHTGFSLLEVLIALVILSVGLLGIAAMMSTSVKSNDSAYMRSQATLLAYDLLDRIRSNSNGSYLPGYLIALGTPAPGSITACTGTGANCSGLELATYDLSQWKTELATLLPSGDGSFKYAGIGPASAPLAIYEVTVAWDDSRGLNSLKAPSATSAAHITTLSVTVLIQD